MSIYIDYSKGPNWLLETIAQLQTTPGVCVFLDLCDSTASKQKPLQEWIIRLANSFLLANHDSPILSSHIVKPIGDELMIYIPDSELGSITYSEILSDLKNTVNHFPGKTGELYLKSKAAIHHCESAYSITFHSKMDPDYYGIDVDLTARYMKESVEGKIIVSAAYRTLLSQDDSARAQMSGPTTMQFKGIADPQSYFILDAS